MTNQHNRGTARLPWWRGVALMYMGGLLKPFRRRCYVFHGKILYYTRDFGAKFFPRTPEVVSMKTVFLSAATILVLSSPNWEHTRKKIKNNKNALEFSTWVSAAPNTSTGTLPKAEAAKAAGTFVSDYGNFVSVGYSGISEIFVLLLR